MKHGLLRIMLSFVAFCFCCVPHPASCTEPGGYHHGGMMEGYDPKESFEQFSRKLNLSKEQKEKVRPILNREVSEIKKVYAAAWEKEKRILEEYQKKVMAVLTPEQKEKYRKMIADRKPAKGPSEKKQQVAADEEIPVIVTVVVAEPVKFYGKSVIAEGYVKRVLTQDSFILSEAPNGKAEIVVVGAGPAVVENPKAGEKVAVRGVIQSFKTDEIEKALGVDLDEGVFGIMENKPGIFARWVKKL